jgi:hypothetical protein
VESSQAFQALKYAILGFFHENIAFLENIAFATKHSKVFATKHSKVCNIGLFSFNSSYGVFPSFPWQ